MMAWYEELDFDENPFSTNPKKYIKGLVNLDDTISEALYRINSGNLLVIQGPAGYARTSILMAIIKRLKGKEKLIYVDCNKFDKTLNIGKILIERHGLLKRLFNKKPTKQVLLLDNVQNLTRENNDRIKYYFDQDYFKSVVFTCTDLKKAKFSDSLIERIGKRVITLEKLDEMDAIELIRNRIGDSDLLTDELIIEIFKHSKENPKKMLKNCDMLATYAFEQNERDRIQYVDVQTVLGDNNGTMV